MDQNNFNPTNNQENNNQNNGVNPVIPNGGVVPNPVQPTPQVQPTVELTQPEPIVPSLDDIPDIVAPNAGARPAESLKPSPVEPVQPAPEVVPVQPTVPTQPEVNQEPSVHPMQQNPSTMVNQDNNQSQNKWFNPQPVQPNNSFNNTISSSSNKKAIDSKSLLMIIGAVVVIVLAIIIGTSLTGKKSNKQESNLEEGTPIPDVLKTDVLSYVDAVEKQIMLSVVDDDAEEIKYPKTYSVSQLAELGVTVKTIYPDPDCTIVIDEKGAVETAEFTYSDYDPYKGYTATYDGKTGKVTITE